jgi:formylglycine-generating enzyme required for sulfatase activity
VIPFRIEDVAPQQSLAYYLGPVHWLDALTSPLDQHLQKLSTSVKGFVRADTSRNDQSTQTQQKAESPQETETKPLAEEQERLRLESKAAASREAEERTRQAAAVEAERERLERDAAAKHDAEEKALQEERRKQEEERQRQEVKAIAQPSRRPLAVTGVLGVVLVSAVGVWLFNTSHTPIQPSPPPVEAPVIPVRPAVQPASSTGVPLSPKLERALKPKDIFKECNDCPELVVVPAGSFIMGSPDSEEDHDPSESPQHKVTIAKPFAVGRFAVTFDEWDACVADGGCNGYKPSDENSGRGRRPVIMVSWPDTKTYLQWLSRKTGKPYRLLSEAEFEYAARAGSKAAFPWGEYKGEGSANCDACGGSWSTTAPVGSFDPNAFGLYEMVGNVWQWVEDCDHENYNGAPTDGSVWPGGDCSHRIVRGGGWPVDDIRSASRYGNPIADRNVAGGFRVARALTPP